MKFRLMTLLSSAILVLTCLSCSERVSNFEYSSAYYKIRLSDSIPFISYFSADGLGRNQLDNNIIGWKSISGDNEFELRKRSGTKVEIVNKERPSEVLWSLDFEDSQFTVKACNPGSPVPDYLDFRFDKNKNHATLLGLMPAKEKTRLPAILHLPDMGTFSLSSDKPGTLVDYSAGRYQGKGHISVKITSSDAKSEPVVYTFRIVNIYPDFEGVEQAAYDGFRRNYLNLYQVNPVFRVLANNSCSDPVAFTLYMSSMLALSTPPLSESLTAMDLVRMSVERYLNGMKGYGLVGYGKDDYEGTEVAAWNSPYNSLDSYPSLIIAACNCIKASGDKEWAEKYYPVIKEWMDSQMKRDKDQNGIVEYELSGNSGTWDGHIRPANWWDTIGFGHEDAFSNTITFDALNLMAAIAGMLGKNEDAEIYTALAGKMKASFFNNFYNPATGVLAGWKSKDGKLHDYYFVMVNGMAVYYDLVPKEKEKEILMTLWNKMDEVGYKDFSLGLPGNLISVRKEDYTHPDPRWGGGQLEDGSDAFQRYENGGASLNWSYFTLMAYKKAGLEDQYITIADGLLKGINEGSFQGSCKEGGMTKDWKTWDGECWGYEGFLCDGYLVISALNPDIKGND